MDHVQEANKKLIDSARLGDKPGVEAALAAGAELDAKDGHGETASMHAAEHGYESCLGLLIAAGADMETPGKDGWTAAAHADREGHPGLASLIEGVVLSRKEAAEMEREVAAPDPSLGRGRGGGGGFERMDRVEEGFWTGPGSATEGRLERELWAGGHGASRGRQEVDWLIDALVIPGGARGRGGLGFGGMRLSRQLRPSAECRRARGGTRGPRPGCMARSCGLSQKERGQRIGPAPGGIKSHGRRYRWGAR